MNILSFMFGSYISIEVFRLTRVFKSCVVYLLWGEVISVYSIHLCNKTLRCSQRDHNCLYDIILIQIMKNVPLTLSLSIHAEIATACVFSDTLNLSYISRRRFVT